MYVNKLQNSVDMLTERILVPCYVILRIFNVGDEFDYIGFN